MPSLEIAVYLTRDGVALRLLPPEAAAQLSDRCEELARVWVRGLAPHLGDADVAELASAAVGRVLDRGSALPDVELVSEAADWLVEAVGEALVGAIPRDPTPAGRASSDLTAFLAHELEEQIAAAVRSVDEACAKVVLAEFGTQVHSRRQWRSTSFADRDEMVSAAYTYLLAQRERRTHAGTTIDGPAALLSWILHKEAHRQYRSNGPLMYVALPEQEFVLDAADPVAGDHTQEVPPMELDTIAVRFAGLLRRAAVDARVPIDGDVMAGLLAELGISLSPGTATREESQAARYQRYRRTRGKLLTSLLKMHEDGTGPTTAAGEAWMIEVAQRLLSPRGGAPIP